MSQSSNNRTGWSNEHYDQTIRLANATTDQQASRIVPTGETMLINDELPIFPLSFMSASTFIIRIALAASIRTSSTSAINAIYAK